MHSETFSFIISVWVIFSASCGAWVHPPQNTFNDRPSISSESVHQALVKAAIIPDVLNDFQPSVYLSLSYPSANKVVDLGNKIKPKKVTSPPIFSIDASVLFPTQTTKSNATYTLVFSDPDATSRAEPVKAQMCHWIVTNLTLPIQSSHYDGAFDRLSFFLSAKEPKNNGIQEVMPYLPPTPPPKTGYHRYVFVLLASKSEKDTTKDLTKPKDRPHWGYGKVGAGVREWADENGLVVVGANYFYSKNKKQ